MATLTIHSILRQKYFLFNLDFQSKLFFIYLLPGVTTQFFLGIFILQKRKASMLFRGFNRQITLNLLNIYSFYKCRTHTLPF